MTPEDRRTLREAVAKINRKPDQWASLVRPPKWIEELVGVAARTQQLVHQLGERLVTLESRVTAHPEAERTYWMIARIRAGAIQLASWSPKAKSKVRWIPDPMMATGFTQHKSAHAALAQFKPSKGTYYTLLRIVL